MRRTRIGYAPDQSSQQATTTAGSPASSAPVKTRDSWLRGRPRSEAMMLEPTIESAPAQTQRLGGLAHVAAVALPGPRRPRSAARSVVPVAMRTARSSVWSSSRTLPGQACDSSAVTASGSRPAIGFR